MNFKIYHFPSPFVAELCGSSLTAFAYGLNNFDKLLKISSRILLGDIWERKRHLDSWRVNNWMVSLLSFIFLYEFDPWTTWPLDLSIFRGLGISTSTGSPNFFPSLEINACWSWRYCVFFFTDWTLGSILQFIFLHSFDLLCPLFCGSWMTKWLDSN